MKTLLQRVALKEKDMKWKIFALSLLIVACSLSFSSSARAETSFAFSVSDGPVYGGYREWDGPRHGPRHGPPRHHYKHHRGPSYYPAYYYAPPVVYVPPVRTVVVEPVPYVVNASMGAEQASPTYIDAQGQTCREYQTSAWVGSSSQPVYGTACLQADGAWRIVD